MPKISLVVCLYKERDLLERLLQQAEGCYEDLVVVHDWVEETIPGEDIGGRRSIQSSSTINSPSVINHQSQCYEEGWKSPEDLSLKEPNAPPIEIARDYAELPKSAPLPTGYRLKIGLPQPGSIHELVNRYGGRFYEGPRCFQQEPHWPFAWWAAKHDWILRLDADEYPSKDLHQWLRNFRSSANPLDSGFLSIWPLWSGKKEIWCQRQASRLFLFNLKQIRFFGMAEHSPVSTISTFVPLPLLIHHRPKRKSYGCINLLLRKQAYRWRSVIACSIKGSPKDLPCWCQEDHTWPKHWQDIRDRPIIIGAIRLLTAPVFQFIYETRRGSEFVPDAYIGTGMHQFLMSLTYFFKRINYLIPSAFRRIANKLG